MKEGQIMMIKVGKPRNVTLSGLFIGKYKTLPKKVGNNK
jgi:hypothetical protein